MSWHVHAALVLALVAVVLALVAVVVNLSLLRGRPGAPLAPAYGHEGAGVARGGGGGGKGGKRA